jgi:hypothetical protein
MIIDFGLERIAPAKVYDHAPIQRHECGKVPALVSTVADIGRLDPETFDEAPRLCAARLNG